MEYEWDDAKRESNLTKHGLDFVDVARFDWNSASILPDEIVDHERRCREIGELDGRIVFIVYVERGDRVRIVSLRAATRKEKAFHGANS